MFVRGIVLGYKQVSNKEKSKKKRKTLKALRL